MSGRRPAAPTRYLLISAIILILMIGGFLPRALADTVSLVPVADTRISPGEDANWDWLHSMAVYNEPGNVQRPLVRFDFSQIPTGAKIKSAVLRLTEAATYYTSQGYPTFAFRVTRPWIETEATGVRATAATYWTNSGGDFVGTSGIQDSDPYAVAYDIGTAPLLFMDVTSLVRAWVEGGVPNYGMLLRAPVGNHLHFHTREAGLPYAPVLAIEYSLPGIVRAWGWGAGGQNGNGTLDDSPSPTTVAGLEDVAAVSDGGAHSLALRRDGTAWAWGGGLSGQLGNGAAASSTYPVKVVGLSDVVAVSAGDQHSIALTKDGVVWAWGYGGNGQLGNGTAPTAPTAIPVQVTGLTDVIAISAGANHNIALKKDGSVWAWGGGWHGQLGNGSTASSAIPVRVTGLVDVVAISSCTDHCLALKKDGTVVAWGIGNYGQLGNGQRSSSSVPVAVSGLTDVVALATSAQHSMALRRDGTVWTWGGNDSGQLGTGQWGYSAIPVPVTALSGIVDIRAGWLASYALRADGTLWAWGNGLNGQLGDGSTGVLSNSPIQTLVGQPVNEFDGGGIHSLGVLARPMAIDDYVSTYRDQPLSMATPGLMRNDYGKYGASVIIVSQPSHGTLVLTQDGSFTYTPHAGFTGADTFTYRLVTDEDSSDPATVTLTVLAPPDTIAPTTSATVLPAANAAGWTGGSRTRVEFRVADNPGGSGVKSVTYQVQNFNPDTVTGDFAAVEMTTEGTRWVTFYATDNAGNAEAVQTITLKMDHTNPVSSALVNGAAAAGPYFTPPTVTFSATDNLSGVAGLLYAVDGGAPQTYTGAFTISTPGQHNISYWAVDVADNVETPRSLSLTYVHDTTAPTTTATASPAPNANGWYRGAVRVDFSATDDPGGSGVKSITYQVPGFSADTVFLDQCAVQTSRQGRLAITYHAEDNVGNVEAEKSITVNIDTTAPVTTATGVSGKTGTVTLAATDNLSGVQNTWYRIDGGAATLYTETIQLLTDGDHVVEYWSADLADNEETHRTITVGVSKPKIRVDGLDLYINPDNTDLLIADVVLTNVSTVSAHLTVPGNGVTLDGVSPLGFFGVTKDLAPGETWTLSVSFRRSQFTPGRKAELALNATYDGLTLSYKKKVTVP